MAHLVLNVQPAASLAGLLILLLLLLLLKVLILLLAVARIDGVVRLKQIISPKILAKRRHFLFLRTDSSLPVAEGHGRGRRLDLERPPRAEEEEEEEEDGKRTLPHHT